MLLIGISCFAVLTYVVLHVAVRANGGHLKLTGSWTHIITLLVLCLTAVQVVSNVSQENSSDLMPAALLSLYRVVALLQLQGVALPPSCTGSYLFLGDVAIFAIALSLWGLSFAFAMTRRGHRLAGLLARIAMFAAVYLHPRVTSGAVNLLNCETLSLSPQELSVMDGGDDTVQTSGQALGQHQALPVLASNTFILCFRGQHTSAGAVALVTLVLFVTLLPAVSFSWLWRDPWLRQAVRGGPPVPDSGEVTPVTSAHARRRSSAITPAAIDIRPAEPVSDANKPRGKHVSMKPDPTLHVFLDYSDYHVHAWWFRHFDMLIVGGLAAIGSIFPLPITITQVGVKLGVTLAILSVSLVVLFCVPNPYAAPWKRSVRFALIALAMGCAALNGVTRAVVLGYDSDLLRASIAPGAYCIVVLFVITVTILLVGFARDVLSISLDNSAPQRAVVGRPDAIRDSAASVSRVGEQVEGLSSSPNSHDGSPSAPVTRAAACTSTARVSTGVLDVVTVVSISDEQQPAIATASAPAASTKEQESRTLEDDLGTFTRVSTAEGYRASVQHFPSSDSESNDSKCADKSPAPQLSLAAHAVDDLFSATTARVATAGVPMSVRPSSRASVSKAPSSGGTSALPPPSRNSHNSFAPAAPVTIRAPVQDAADSVTPVGFVLDGFESVAPDAADSQSPFSSDSRGRYLGSIPSSRGSVSRLASAAAAPGQLRRGSFIQQPPAAQAPQVAVALPEWQSAQQTGGAPAAPVLASGTGKYPTATDSRPSRAPVVEPASGPTQRTRRASFAVAQTATLAANAFVAHRQRRASFTIGTGASPLSTISELDRSTLQSTAPVSTSGPVLADAAAPSVTTTAWDAGERAGPSTGVAPAVFLPSVSSILLRQSSVGGASSSTADLTGSINNARRELRRRRSLLQSTGASAMGLDGV